MEYELPFFDERNAPIDTVILHCNAFNAEQAVESFRQAEVSAHYLIGLDGKVRQLVDDDKRAWHAGKSFWQGREGINHNSIGIEICNLSLGQSAYDKKQIRALIYLCRKLMKKYNIKPQNVLGHSDIAPTRKPDPGVCFPWRYLARHGIGRWYNLQNADKVTETDEVKMLKSIGYDVSDLTAAKWAFCRHWLPDEVPVDKDIMHLLDNPYNKSFDADEHKFMTVLKAVYWQLCVKNQKTFKTQLTKICD